jgi:hypothetical protein
MAHHCVWKADARDDDMGPQSPGTIKFCFRMSTLAQENEEFTARNERRARRGQLVWRRLRAPRLPTLADDSAFERGHDDFHAGLEKARGGVDQTTL